MRKRRQFLVARLSIRAAAITELGIVSSESSNVRSRVERKPTLSTNPSDALDGDVLANPERVLADQQQRPEEILERILGRERRGQADQAEPGQELRERLMAADQIDLARYGQQARRRASGRWRPSARSCR